MIPFMAGVNFDSVIISETEPSGLDRKKLWIKVDTTNKLIKGFYILENNTYSLYIIAGSASSNISVNPQDTTNMNIWIEDQ